MIIKNPITPGTCCTLPSETLVSENKTVINDKLQGSVATYLRWCGCQ